MLAAAGEYGSFSVVLSAPRAEHPLSCDTTKQCVTSLMEFDCFSLPGGGGNCTEFSVTTVSDCKSGHLPFAHNGIYEFHYRTTVAGAYAVSITYNGDALSGTGRCMDQNSTFVACSMWTVYVPAAAPSNRTYAESALWTSLPILYQSYNIYVTPIDEYGNLCDCNLDKTGTVPVGTLYAGSSVITTVGFRCLPNNVANDGTFWFFGTMSPSALTLEVSYTLDITYGDVLVMVPSDELTFYCPAGFIPVRVLPCLLVEPTTTTTTTTTTLLTRTMFD